MPSKPPAPSWDTRRLWNKCRCHKPPAANGGRDKPFYGLGAESLGTFPLQGSGVLSASVQNEIQPILLEDMASSPLHLKFRSQGPSPHTLFPEDGRPPSGQIENTLPSKKQTNKNELFPESLIPRESGASPPASCPCGQDLDHWSRPCSPGGHTAEAEQSQGSRLHLQGRRGRGGTDCHMMLRKAKVGGPAPAGAGSNCDSSFPEELSYSHIHTPTRGHGTAPSQQRQENK